MGDDVWAVGLSADDGPRLLRKPLQAQSETAAGNMSAQFTQDEAGRVDPSPFTNGALGLIGSNSEPRRVTRTVAAPVQFAVVTSRYRTRRIKT